VNGVKLLMMIRHHVLRHIFPLPALLNKKQHQSEQQDRADEGGGHFGRNV
jgi:hypothetical protein